MRKFLLFLTVAISACAAAACEASKTADAPPDVAPAFTIREIMQSMVEPRADSLWNAVSTSVTEKGVETQAPKNDEEWANMRHEAVTLHEAMNLILMPGRKVARPGEQAKDPNVELTPDQIEMLINQDRGDWAKLARALQDSVLVAVKAIDAKDADALSSAGGGIDTACETFTRSTGIPRTKSRSRNDGGEIGGVEDREPLAETFIEFPH